MLVLCELWGLQIQSNNCHPLLPHLFTEKKKTPDLECLGPAPHQQLVGDI